MTEEHKDLDYVFEKVTVKQSFGHCPIFGYPHSQHSPPEKRIVGRLNRAKQNATPFGQAKVRRKLRIYCVFHSQLLQSQ